MREKSLKSVVFKKFDKSHYEGSSASTLCLGCGHDQVSKHIIQACWTAGLNPSNIAKISGIGCSSKTPGYFLKKAMGFNTIHGRMASVATGVKVANRDLKVIGVSGDGDTGSIGLGSFLHTARKNIPMVYIVENNGVYGLTKGQFAVTAKKGTVLKHQSQNLFNSMDLCQLALSAGCGFVARSFSGDVKQLTQLLKLAFAYEGFAFIDVISPCVAYGNEKDFPHSFSRMKQEKAPLHELDIIEPSAVDTEIKEGEKIPLQNGNILLLKKLGDKDHNPLKKDQAWQVLNYSFKNQELATGLIYYKEQSSFLDKEELSQKALSGLKESEIRLKSQNLQEILNGYK